MCLKEVDLNINRTCQSEKQPDREESEPNQIPPLSCESPHHKNGWREITEKERRDSQLKNCLNGSGNSVAHKGARIRAAEQKNQPQEIQKIKLSSAFLKWCWILAAVNKWQLCGTKVLSSAVQKLPWKPDTVVKWIVLLQLIVSGAGAAGDIFLGNGFSHSIKLNCQVPPFSQAKWLWGLTAIFQNVDENQNLIIDLQDMKTYVCEIRLPNVDPVLHRFPMKAFHSCVVPENEDFDDFKKGRKYAVFELRWKAVVESSSVNVSQQYILMIQNHTLEISLENRTDLQPQLASIQCNIRFKEIVNGFSNSHNTKMKTDTNVSNATDEETTTIKEGDKGKSSDKEKSCDSMIVGMVYGATVTMAIVICLGGCWCIIKRCWRAQDNRNKVKAVPAVEGGHLIQICTTC